MDRLRRPEYTGENRCRPCTVVNSIVAVGLAAGIALLWLPAGITALAVFGTAIYLRGYLVPGTPEVTRRYFPPWLLRAFGKEPFEHSHTTDGGEPIDVGDDRSEPERVERLLRAGDVVEDCSHEDDLCLTAEFRAVWWRRIRTYREDDGRAAAQLATVLDIDPEDLSFVDEGEYFGVEFAGELIGRWDSEAAFYADLAAEPTLAEWLSDWDSLGDRTRTELLAGMRAFLAECPACEAELDQVENVRKSCCAGELASVSVDCPDCGARVFSGRYA